MRKLMQEKEQMEISCHPHPRVLVWPIAVGLLAIMLGSAALARLQPGTFSEWGYEMEWLREPLVVAVVASVVVLLLAYPIRRVLRWAGTMYFLTNQRVLIRTGLRRRQPLILPFDQVREVRAVQNWRQRMSGSGDLQLLMLPDKVVRVREIPNWNEFNKDAQQFWAMAWRTSMQQTIPEQDYAGVVGMNEKELRKLGRNH